MLLELLLVHKSDAFFCPLYRPLSLRRRHIIILSSFPDPMLVPTRFSEQPFLPPPSHSNNNNITSQSHHVTQCLHPPTPPSLVPTYSIRHHHACHLSKPFVHNTHNICIFTAFLGMSSISISYYLHNLNTHPLVPINFFSTHDFLSSPLFTF